MDFNKLPSDGLVIFFIYVVLFFFCLDTFLILYVFLR